MFRFVVCSLLVVSIPALAENPSLLEQIAKTRTDEELAEIARRVEARESFLVEDERRAHGDALYALGVGWLESKENDRARAVFEKLLLGWAETHGGAAALGLGDIYRRLDQPDEAIASYQRALRAQDVRTSWGVYRASSISNSAYWALSILYEEVEDWKNALDAWTAWKPSAGCGTCLVGQQWSRVRGMARCRAALGDVEGALALLDRHIDRDNDWGLDLYAVTLYARILSDAGRIDEASVLLAMTPASQRDVVDTLVEIAERAAADDPEGVLDALGEPEQDAYRRGLLPWAMYDAAERLNEMGEEAKEALEYRLDSGDLAAALMVEAMEAFDLIPQLQKAVQKSESPANREALERILKRVQEDRAMEKGD